jgi:Lon protease-like protein
MTLPTAASAELPLFPLQAVLFPGGLLALRVFETRYLDLMTACLRDRTEFGVVALRRGGEVRRPNQTVAFENLGTRAELLAIDSAQTGILQVRCRGGERFEVRTSHQQPDGLWMAVVDPVDADAVVPPTAALAGAARGLADAVAALVGKNAQPFLEPHRFDDAGWVANRWCELLPIPLAARQKLLELRDPLVRLKIVDDFLRQKGVLP